MNEEEELDYEEQVTFAKISIINDYVYNLLIYLDSDNISYDQKLLLQVRIDNLLNKIDNVIENIEL